MLGYLVASVFLLAASHIDMLSYRIPNWLNVAGVVAGAALSIKNPGFFMHGLIWGAAFGLFFYFLGVFGAGDAKMLIALGSIVGQDEIFALFLLSITLMALWSIPVRLVKWGFRRTWETEKQGLMFLLLKIKLQRPEIEKLDVAKAPFAPFVLFGYIAVQLAQMFGGDIFAYLQVL